jgi:hypothetical protein
MDPLHILEALGSFATAAAVIAFVRRYRAAQAWREQTYWADQIAAIKSDPSARIAMQLLEYDGRRVDLFPHETDQKKRFWVVAHGELAQALRPQGTERFEEVEARLRDIFDDFLDHFERLDRLAAQGLVDRATLLPHLGSWFDAILDTRLEDPDTLDGALLRYIVHYEFDGTRRLLEAYESEVRGAASSKLALPPYVAPPGGHRGWRIAREDRKEREIRLKEADGDE